MKISMNAKIIRGPWGGGNQAALNIIKNMIEQGHKVDTKLKLRRYDLIFIISSIPSLRSNSYSIEKIKEYLKVYPQTPIVHRINTNDARKGSALEDDFVLKANSLADMTIFISSYLKDYYISKGFDSNKPNVVIKNGANENIYNPKGYAKLSNSKKLKITTHHWSNNYMKGFDIYERFDLLLNNSPYNKLFEFTIIGNIPPGLNLKNTKVIAPLSGYDLAKELKNNHLYLTASRNEPAGMHHIEGMRCGLPILYLNSGALPEYCSPYGLSFTLLDFEDKLLEIHNKYEIFKQKVLDCPYTDSWMALQYVEIFQSVLIKNNQNHILTKSLSNIWNHIKYFSFYKPTSMLRVIYSFFLKIIKMAKKLFIKIF